MYVNRYNPLMEIKLHFLQKELVRKLTLSPTLRFNELRIEGVESEHMNYHLRKLIETGFIIKNEIHYTLTDQGKDFSNLLDDSMESLEKQPKCSVIINGVRLNSEGHIEFLLNRRLRQPYFGKVGRVSGKVHFGESLKDAAQRELLEETGLTASFWQLEMMYRKVRVREDGTTIQDVFFYIFFARDFEGEFTPKTLFQENFWATKSHVETSPQIDAYDDLILEERIEPRAFVLEEAFAKAVDY